MLKLYPYKIGSQSAKNIARALRVKRIIPGGRYVPGRRVCVVNWGSSTMPNFNCRIINNPRAVAIAANKLSTLTTLKAAGVATPDFTRNKEEAMLWQEDGYRVVVRHQLSSHSGRGIQVCQPEEPLPNAPLYTKYTRKDAEYRVHVFQGNVIDWSEKVQRNGIPPTNTLIRNHANGWVFCREGRTLPDFGRLLCIRAVAALGLDFGAVDLIVREGKAYILEVNTAPGAEGTTLQVYVNAFRRFL